jgi:hypothetical protein
MTTKIFEDYLTQPDRKVGAKNCKILLFIDQHAAHAATSKLYTCACRGSSGQKPRYGLMMLAYQHFTAVLLLIYGSLSKWGLSLSECILACHRKNVEA